MTNEYCQQYCGSRGYSIAGTEWSRECFCDNAINNSLLADDATCDMTCTGDAQICGGPAHLTVWQNQGTVTQPSQTTFGDWVGFGCFIDSVANRALPTRMWIDGMTVEKCTAACYGGGFMIAGVEYGSECYCSNNIITSANAGSPATGGCDMPCEGNVAQTCGSGNLLNLYAYTGVDVPTGPAQVQSTATQVQATGDWVLRDCFSDKADDRTLPIRQYVDGGMTVEKCTAKCLTLGYLLSGVEYANECYCSNTIGASGTPANEGCNMACEGAASTEICGGSDRLTVYEYGLEFI
ncbi:hypothetical protein M408DRAFT_334294 [Serendipita vermifera MAFF 305830]|uniref:WSC domain-containing protein n=1 Tax=Serendipita vermifera MAFF 305830 TaxID=933852 RepID=A0A0C2VZK0_SERVB|nr:hypothetical protein M408DRAFT_334294 [Serendipita vermifera MAFF 305830]